MKSWATNQAVIALSSGEAEYYGLVKGASMGLGAVAIIHDLGCEYENALEIRTDASAAIGIANRIGIGKIRHIETNQLWLQQKVLEGKLVVSNVKGADNLAAAVDLYLGAEVSLNGTCKEGHSGRLCEVCMAVYTRQGGTAPCARAHQVTQRSSC